MSRRLTVVIDFLTPMALLGNWSLLRRADEITFYTSQNTHNGEFLFPFARWLCRSLLGKELRRIRPKVYDYFCNNPRVVETIERRSDLLAPEMVSYLTEKAKASETEARNFLKKCRIDRCSLQALIAERLRSDNAESESVIVTDADPYGFFEGLTISTVNCFPRILSLRWLVVIVAFLVATSRKLARLRVGMRRRPPEYAEYYAQVNTFVRADGIKRDILPSDYLYDKTRNALYVTDLWPVPGDVTEPFRKFLDDNGFKWISFENFRVTPGFIIAALGFAVSGSGRVSPGIGTWSDLTYLLRFLSGHAIERACMENYDCRAMMCMDDYSERHFIRTWLHRQRGIRTFGIHHSACNGIYGNPSLAYICLDRLFVWGTFVRELYGSYWNDVPIVKFGYNRIDRMVADREAGTGQGEEDQIDIPRNGRKNIVITLPKVTRIETFLDSFSNAEAVLEFLRQAGRHLVADANFLLRPKNRFDRAAFEREIGGTPVTWLVNDNWSTAQYLSQADLVIAQEGSGIIADCAVLKVPVVCFEYVGCEKDIWDRYGGDTYSTTAEGLVDVVRRFATGETLDIDWPRLWEEVSYRYSADRVQIIGREVEACPDPRDPPSNAEYRTSPGN